MSLYDAIKAIEESRFEPQIQTSTQSKEYYLYRIGSDFEKHISLCVEGLSTQILPPHPLFTCVRQPKRTRPITKFTPLNTPYALSYDPSGRLTVVSTFNIWRTLREIDFLLEFDDTYVLGEAKLRKLTDRTISTKDRGTFKKYFADTELYNMIDFILPKNKPLERWLITDKDSSNAIMKNPDRDLQLDRLVSTYLNQGNRILSVPVAWPEKTNPMIHEEPCPTSTGMESI